MLSKIAINASELSKCFHLYNKSSDRLKQILSRGRRKYFKDFWALKNVSLEVKKGETVGIIGRNGSGKSTLLQLICGTLNPTKGKITVNGKVAALLELGTGFNPEFTGRENVYMAATLFGLTQSQVDTLYDQIAEFADIGDYINQPVKTYSSGMYVRLAFAVIAHVSADILLIDEALAVGDAVFTQKCMRFIRKFKENGTLIFVSHDMNSVLNLCERAVWLHGGEVKRIGKAKDVAEDYLQFTMQEAYGQDVKIKSIKKTKETYHQKDKSAIKTKPQIDYEAQWRVDDNLSQANGWMSGAGEIVSARFESLSSSSSNVFKGGERVRIIIRAVAHQSMTKPIVGFLLRDRLGQDLFGENTLPYTNFNPQFIRAGSFFESSFTFQLPMLPNGQYSVMASLAEGDLHNHVQHHWLHDALIVNVSSSKVRWGLVGVNFEELSMKEIQ